MERRCVFLAGIIKSVTVLAEDAAVENVIGAELWLKVLEKERMKGL